MRKKTIEITKQIIEHEDLNSDPIYNQINKWYLDGIPIEIIQERVEKYSRKKDKNN